MTNHLLGTVIYDHNNVNDQTLIITDRATNQTEEYKLEDGRNILFKGRRIPVSQLLSEDNVKNLEQTRKEQSLTSFILSQKELLNAQQLKLTDFITQP